MITLNAEQTAAVEATTRAVRAAGAGRGTVTVVSGPAGTGKTTTLRAAVAAVGAGHVRIVAPTGRAALRASEASGVAATTIHKWLYGVEEDPITGKVRFQRRPTMALDETTPELLIVDEASMVSHDTWADISFVCQAMGRSMLLVGDGFQLPPVEMDDAKKWFSVFAPEFQAHERVQLREVFRQALESPVLRCATTVRTSTWEYALSAVRRELPELKGKPGDHAATWRRNGTDAVVIAHRNETRQRLNGLTRIACGVTDLSPQHGEPLLVRRNSDDLGVVNGEIIEVAGGGEALEVPESLEKPEPVRFNKHDVNGLTAALFYPAVLGGDEPGRGALKRLFRAGVPYLRAQLGYAVTCHSAQGSEWDQVMLVLERSLGVMPEEDRCRWLYTAITRAKTMVHVSYA